MQTPTISRTPINYNRAMAWGFGFAALLAGAEWIAAAATESTGSYNVYAVRVFLFFLQFPGLLAAWMIEYPGESNTFYVARTVANGLFYWIVTMLYYLLRRKFARTSPALHRAHSLSH